MSQIDEVKSALRWFFSLGQKFFKVSPLNTLAIVFSTLLSQISALLSSFLPLKIIILLGSEGIPRYFPPSWAQYERDHLIIAMCLATLAFYLLYLLAEKMIVYFTARGTRRLLFKTRKIQLFADQDQKAGRAYKGYSENIAAIVFVTLVLVFLLVFYLRLFLVMLIFGLLMSALVMLGLYSWPRMQKAWDEDAGSLMKVVASLGFFVAFVFIIVEFLFASPPGFILVIISVLLIRQMLGKCSSFVTNQKRLYADRLVINALFFKEHVLIEDTSKQHREFWSLLDEHHREEWIKTVLQRLADVDGGDLRIEWHQSGIPDVAMFLVQSTSDQEADNNSWLVKLFGPARAGQALHESALLSSIKLSIFPAPVFLGAEQVEKCLCHLFSWPEAVSFTGKELTAAIEKMRQQLLATPVDKKIEERYIAGRQLLPQRLSSDIPERVRLAAKTEEELGLVDSLEANLTNIKENLTMVPLQYINPDLRANTLWEDPARGLILSHWGNWKLEPLAADLPLKSANPDVLTQLLEQITAKRSDPGALTPAHLELVIRSVALEAHYNRQDFRGVIAQLPALFDVLKKLEADMAVE